MGSFAHRGLDTAAPGKAWVTVSVSLKDGEELQGALRFASAHPNSVSLTLRDWEPDDEPSLALLDEAVLEFVRRRRHLSGHAGVKGGG
ncbi:MAG: hypothetical protein JOZ39_03550 [Chloroflexi bacterium]|nr:hypothetical protein [Chloroflexota bacterium]